ncbi:MAG: oligoribonuclease [Gammaproteobacteria bacterium]|nr:MAG: oligoribonuclease [Gammaproteobacteria bacterium]|tara:strand:- start:2509 stop:3090 length:582 start_codon:yes stop_codon:yes gene_type:complete
MDNLKNLNKSKNLIWIDLEMTGLDTQNDNIIEIATIVTNQDLEIIAEGPEIVINQTKTIMDEMDEWNTKHHGKSGLTDKVLLSKITTQDAEIETLNFLKKFVKAGISPMCGNSICQDRRFLARQMPELEKFFHYRNLDVSSLNILSNIWRPDIAKSVKKSSKHRALEDIKDSINELIHYKSTFFNLDYVSNDE